MPEPPARVADLTHAYDREVTPYHPFTASEMGLRQYDQVLANDIGPEHRRSLEARVEGFDVHMVDDPRRSLFYEPIRNFPARFDPETRRALTASYVAAIQQSIVPAYRRLRSFIHDEYLPRCRTSYGFRALPDGRRWYAHAVRDATTTDLQPTEIFELGRAEVKRIRAAMDALRAEIAAARRTTSARSSAT